MSTSEQITRIQTARNTIRTKLVELGLVASTAQIDALATAISNIVNNGTVNAEVKEGESYTIPAGYHSGTGIVKGVSGGGNYNLQDKSVTPTKSQQSVTPDSGYYGLSGVTVGAIPENYQDVSSVDATAADVLANKKIVDATGKLLAGTMPNNGAVDVTLKCNSDPTYTVPKGYHNGSGVVKVNSTEATVTPTKERQVLDGYSNEAFYEVVTVEPIPDAYQDVTAVTAAAAQVLLGKVIVDTTGAKVTGTMPDRGAVAATIDGISVTSYTIPKGYHNGSGTVSLTDDIENALAAI
ncbi:MAG: hypothetical protein IJ043_03060 [Clostridia bacterium]|nr:hypothetical protein [Clostridia bacterium]